MKKLQLFMLGLLIAGSANAQYFQHVYGQGNFEDVLSSGVNSSVGPQGHIMAGYTNFGSPFGANSVMVTRTDQNGNILGAPFFNNRYQILENGVAVNAMGRKTIQLANGQIAVFGDYSTTLSITTLPTHFFYLLLNADGTVATARSYSLSATPAEVRATSICPTLFSTTLSGDVFVSGYVVNTAGARAPMLMRLQSGTGNIVWSSLYQPLLTTAFSMWTANDLVESPYPTTTGIPDIAVVGHFRGSSANPESGCFFSVSSATGLMTSPINLFGTTTDNAALNSIDVSNSAFVTRGFVVSGYAHNPATLNDDTWAMKLNPAGNGASWSTLLDYSIPGANNYGNDIIERLNAAGNFEYYVGGNVANGVFGLNDALVFKLDFAGNPVPGADQFTYGGAGDDFALELDQYNGTGFDGLSTYGTTNGSFPVLGGTDFYLVKSYFNGITTCSFDLQPSPRAAGPVFINSTPAINSDGPKADFLRASAFPTRNATICFATAIGGGSNARLAQAQTTQQLSEPGYFPNPVSRDNAIINVTFGNDVVAGDADIELWNAVGQLVWTKKASLTDGQTQMQVDLGSELSGGMYHLIVRQNGNVNNYRIVVQ